MANSEWKKRFVNQFLCAVFYLFDTPRVNRLRNLDALEKNEVQKKSKTIFSRQANKKPRSSPLNNRTFYSHVVLMAKQSGLWANMIIHKELLLCSWIENTAAGYKKGTTKNILSKKQFCILSLCAHTQTRKKKWICK